MRIVGTIFVVLIGSVALAGPSPLERYFQGLRERGLLDLAEGELLRRLAEPNVSTARQAVLTAELARTFGRHALFTQDAEQADLRQRADRLLREFLEQHDNFTNRDAFRVLQGELLFERGRADRWRAQLHPAEPAARSEARATLSQAVDHLTALEPELVRHLKIQRRDAVTALELPTAVQLGDLLRQTRILLGNTELERARLAEPDERTAALQAAEAWLDKAIDSGGAPVELWPARAALAEASLLAGDGDQTRLRLAEIDTVALGNTAKDAVAEVMAELLIAEGSPDRAVTFLIDYRRERGSLTGALRLLQIRGLAESAALLKERGEEQAAQALRDEVETVVKWTTAEHGGYWAYRARLAARNIEQRANFGAELLEELRLAQLEIDLGHPEVAAGHFEEAARLATDPQQAASFQFSRGRLLSQANLFEKAAQVLAAIPEQYPDSEHAAAAHFYSALALGRWHDAEPSAVRREAYLARLREHRDRFPDSATAPRAALRLAGVHEQRRQYSQALPPLREIVDDPAYGTVAAAAIARNHDKILAYLAKAEREAASPELAATRARQREEWAAAAREELLALTEPLRLAPESAPLTTFQAELALRAAGILMEDPIHRSATSALVDRLITAPRQPHPAGEADFWKAIETSARPLAVVSLARRRQYQAAEAKLRELAAAPLGDLLDVYRGLLATEEPRGSAADELPIVFGPRPDALRAILLEMLDERRRSLSPDDVRQLDLALARAESQAGDANRAAARYARAVEGNPEDRELLQHAAEALSESSDPNLLKQAREYWRRLERESPSGSDAWWLARLGTIETSLALGERDEARKRLAVTKLLHPDLGGPETRSRFEALEQRAEGRRDGGSGEAGEGEKR